MIVAITGQCQWAGCSVPATKTAGTRRYIDEDDPNASVLRLGMFCDKHAVEVSAHGDPEYVEECPNCKCVFGVN